jgi:hypothetical protein
MQPVPDWMLKHIQDARSLFGIGGPEWHVTARLTDKPLGSEDNDGGVHVDGVYMNAQIEMRDGLEDNDNARDDIYHEVLHIPHDEIDHLVSRIIGELPEADQDRYHDLYNELVERFVQRLSRSICAGLKKEVE